jgi:ssDNA thymidine ADP-ribosyltransferase, DarT
LAVPNPIRLFHITAIANLAGICSSGSLLSKSIGSLSGVNYQNIAHGGAQGARAAKFAPNPPGGTIHDYVPFYFAPRSPMLMAIDKGRVAGCNLRQSDILHFETTVPRVVAMNKSMIFYDRNATLAYSVAYTNLNMLPTAIAWDLLTEAPQLDGFCKWWNNKTDTPKYADRMERRQAEFLVKDALDLSAMTRIGVIDLTRKKQVEQILNAAKVTLPVSVIPEWYF